MSRWLWLALIVVVLDQATKWAVISAIEPFSVIEIVPNINLTLTFNTGAAFSFLAAAGGWQRWLFAGFAAIVAVVLVVWIRRLPPGDGLLAAALALILGGATGNLIDRVLLGHVIDFVQVYLPFLPWKVFNPWPAFNVADSAIFVGVVLLLIHTARTDDSKGVETGSRESAD